ncbi:MAG: hypothetical protein N2038_15310 [Geminicoccaceae bacterium]|nr:hypothetical protein [Geminicoccaceae bacterium]
MLDQAQSDALAPVLKLVDDTIASLKRKTFEVDPIVDKRYSAIASIVSSAYKRHGRILEEALAAALRRAPHLVVWSESEFAVSDAAERLAETDDLSRDADLPYEPKNVKRRLQIDLIVFNKNNTRLGAYESKRGFGYHDSGKKRSMLRDLRCQQMLLRSYGKFKGYQPSDAVARMIFYYGQCSLGKPWGLRGDDLDEHFQFPVKAWVEKVNEHFKRKLHDLLSTL